MDEKQNESKEDNRQTARREGRETNIGAGKKVGLYGCAFLVLAVIIILVVLILTGIYAPFSGSEGVGP